MRSNLPPKPDTKKYLNGNATRLEVQEMIEKSNREKDEVLRHMYIYTTALTELLIEKGILTEEELNKAAEPIVNSLYGKQAEETIQMEAQTE